MMCVVEMLWFVISRLLMLMEYSEWNGILKMLFEKCCMVFVFVVYMFLVGCRLMDYLLNVMLLLKDVCFRMFCCCSV